MQDKTSITDITDLKIKGQMGNMVPVSDLVKVRREELQKTIYRKDQKRVVYVIGRYGRRFRKSSVCNSRNGRKIEKNTTSKRLYD